MNPVGLLLVTTAAAIAGASLVVTGWRRRPSLSSAVRHLHRPPDDENHTPATLLGSIGTRVLDSPFSTRAATWRTTTRLVERPLEVHLGLLVTAAITGLAIPVLALAGGRALGVGTATVAVPAAVSLGLAVLLPVLAHSNTVSSADEVRLDLRHQLSAYFDMVTMLLAGNTGHEGAVTRAAAAGDGLLFRQLRRRLREVGATGRSGIGALALVAEDYDLDELRQVAATASLSAAEGAPVARTLAAKCATLRSTMAADQEARARVRNDKITPPMVGMALLFMALVIYPALGLG
jgi:tight adherence protein C